MSKEWLFQYRQRSVSTSCAAQRDTLTSSPAVRSLSQSGFVSDKAFVDVSKVLCAWFTQKKKEKKKKSPEVFISRGPGALNAARRGSNCCDGEV